MLDSVCVERNGGMESKEKCAVANLVLCMLFVHRHSFYVWVGAAPASYQLFFLVWTVFRTEPIR